MNFQGASSIRILKIQTFRSVSHNSIKSGTAAGKAVAAVTVMHVDKKAATHPAKMEVYSV